LRDRRAAHHRLDRTQVDVERGEVFGSRIGTDDVRANVIGVEARCPTR